MIFQSNLPLKQHINVKMTSVGFYSRQNISPELETSHTFHSIYLINRKVRCDMIALFHQNPPDVTGNSIQQLHAFSGQFFFHLPKKTQNGSPMHLWRAVQLFHCPCYCQVTWSHRLPLHLNLSQTRLFTQLFHTFQLLCFREKNLLLSVDKMLAIRNSFKKSVDNK